MVVSLANSTRNTYSVRFVQAMMVNLAQSTRTVSLIRRGIATSVALAHTVRVVALNRAGRALVVGLVQVFKSTGRAKDVIVLAVNRALGSRTLHYILNSQAMRIMGIGVRRIVSFTRIARPIAVGIVSASKVLGLNRLAKVLLVPFGGIFKKATQSKSSTVLQAASVTVTKGYINNRGVRVTATYLIGTSKSRTYARKAIAMAVARVRFGITAAVKNIRMIGDKVSNESVNQTSNYALSNNEDLPINPTVVNDPGAADYIEPGGTEGDATIPEPK